MKSSQRNNPWHMKEHWFSDGRSVSDSTEAEGSGRFFKSTTNSLSRRMIFRRKGELRTFSDEGRIWNLLPADLLLKTSQGKDVPFILLCGFWVLSYLKANRIYFVLKKTLPLTLGSNS